MNSARAELVAAHPDATVLVVTHTTPIKALVCAALDAPLSSMYRSFLDVASVSVLDWVAGGAGTLRLFNDTAHLPSS